MNKADKKQIERALDAADANAGYAANSLATLHRAANAKTQREIAALIESRPALRLQLRMINGCYVPA